MSNAELKIMLENNKVKYLIKNTMSYDIFADEYVKFFEKVENSNLFPLVAKKEGKYFIWQVY